MNWYCCVIYVPIKMFVMNELILRISVVFFPVFQASETVKRLNPQNKKRVVQLRAAFLTLLSFIL